MFSLSENAKITREVVLRTEAAVNTTSAVVSRTEVALHATSEVVLEVQNDQVKENDERIQNPARKCTELQIGRIGHPVLTFYLQANESKIS
jgi:hypothetical protein